MSRRNVDKLTKFILTASQEDIIDLPLEVVVQLIKEKMKLEPLRGLLEDELLVKHSRDIVSLLPENVQTGLLLEINQKPRLTKVELILRVVIESTRGTKLFAKRLKRKR